MFRLYYSIFSISYDSLRLYHSINEIDKWNHERILINSKINNIILSFLSKRTKRKKINDQFFLDYINFFLCHHISNRKKYYNEKVSKFTFIFLSFIDKYLISFRLILSSIKNYVLNYNLDNIAKISDCTVCIGFPEHAFSYSNEYNSNPSSFVEFSLNNNIFNEDENILSIEEYKRPSFKHDRKRLNFLSPKSFKRNSIKKKLSFLKAISVLPALFYFYIISFKNNKTLSISVFSYFFRNEQISIRNIDLIRKLKTINISINNIIFLHTHYIYGKVFKGLDEKKIKTFHYSQNYQLPTSSIISDWLSQNLNSTTINVDSIVKELYIRLFSEYYLNPINFSYHGKFFSKIRSLLNEKFKINLIGLDSLEEKTNKYKEGNNYSNVGYENIETIDLKSSRTILFLDNSIESRDENISRNMFGDFIALEEFMFEFYKEIISVAKSLDYKLYYKGKYWQEKNSQSVLDKASMSLNYNIHKIDPYSKLALLNNKKFDCILNYPFTSTYFTFSNLGDRNLFFIPTNYVTSFDKNTKDICLGKNNLEKKLKNYENNRR